MSTISFSPSASNNELNHEQEQLLMHADRLIADQAEGLPTHAVSAIVANVHEKLLEAFERGESTTIEHVRFIVERETGKRRTA